MSDQLNQHESAMDRRTFLTGSLAAGALAAVGAEVAFADEAEEAEEAEADEADEAEEAEEAEEEEESTEDVEVSETYDCDICVVGCGASGFMASIVAAKAGANVITVEKGAAVTAANGVYVSGPFAVGTDVLENREGGTTLTVDDVFYYVMEYTHWTPNPSLDRRCLETSKYAVSMLEDIGYEFEEANFRFETQFKDEKGGFHKILTETADRVTMWNDALDEYGVQVLWSTSMTSLVKDGDAVCGILATAEDGSTIQVNAGAVILATGGYLGNRDLQERFLHTRKLNVAKGGESLCTGDGILAAEEAGAALDKTFGYCPCEYGGTNSKASRPAMQDAYDQNYAFKFGYYGNLLVDAEGKRFINEGLLCDYPMSYGSEQVLKNSPWYAVVDQTYVDAMTNEGIYEYMTARGATEDDWFIGNYFEGRVLDNLPSDLEEGIEEGWCWTADTIEELADTVGLPNLVETVEQYNEYCENGVDEQFGANSWYLSSVTTPPFYVTENEPAAWSTFGGIRIDDQCRACTIDNLPIDGLYAVGTDAGSLYYSPYYDIPGYCYGLCIDSGYIAATEACVYVGVLESAELEDEDEEAAEAEETEETAEEAEEAEEEAVEDEAEEEEETEAEDEAEEEVEEE